ncbi:hypothetical protein ACFL4T_12530, partial [candidate division KSB1 bacterium]
MKHFKKVCFFLLLITVALQAQEIPEKAMKSITADELFKHLKYLASDEMRGRNTPSPELDKAADYIANEFRSYGLKPLDPEGDFLQKSNCFQIDLDMAETSDGIPNKLAVIENGIKKSYKIKNDFTPYQHITNGEITAPVVFAGYG